MTQIEIYEYCFLSPFPYRFAIVMVLHNTLIFTGRDDKHAAGFHAPLYKELRGGGKIYYVLSL
jgi:hypothetical protein